MKNMESNNMDSKERLRLLSELDKIEQSLKVGCKKRHRGRQPKKRSYGFFVRIFKMYYEDNIKISPIAKSVGANLNYVSAIINGRIPIPRLEVEELKKMNVKICSCCNMRAVPYEPINYVKLTTLCPICFMLGDEETTYSINKRCRK